MFKYYDFTKYILSFDIPKLISDACHWGDWSGLESPCNKVVCGPQYVKKIRKSLLADSRCKNETILQECPLNDCSK